MRRFLVQNWGLVYPFTVVWCKAVKCDDCRLRFDCWTRNEDYTLLRKKSQHGYEFRGQPLPAFIEGMSDGARLGMSIESLVEYVIAGEASKDVPSGQWNCGWVYQAGCRCPEKKITPRNVSDSYFNRELKVILFPCKECKESFICKATNRYRK